ncbi:DNA polymerase [Corynebacterium hadale]
MALHDGVVGLPRSTDEFRIGLTTHGCEMSSLAKADVEAALESATGKVKEVLELRGDLAKSPVEKHQAMHNVTGTEGRARGLIQFYGAGRTGRFAVRLVKVQNLPDLDQARTLTRQRNFDALELLYDSVPDTLSQLIRTAFIPSTGCRFIVADYSAIEARVITWLAGETSTLAAFRDGKDLYCETASRMFGVSVEKHGINAELRQKGIATLACGYNGSVGALKAMGALRMGLAPGRAGTQTHRRRLVGRQPQHRATLGGCRAGRTRRQHHPPGCSAAQPSLHRQVRYLVHHPALW